MAELIQDVYWNKSMVFLLPLTELKRKKGLEIRSYVRWGEYSIENYELIVKIKYDDFDLFQQYMENIEIEKVIIKDMFNFTTFAVLIFDISYWKSEIEFFFQGKYSKFSQQAKEIIQYYYIDENKEIPIKIYCCLFPNDKIPQTGDLTCMEYAIKHYVMIKPIRRLDIETAEMWRDIGELCSLCDFNKETLLVDDSKIDTPLEME